MHSRHATPPLPIHNASSAIDARAHTVIAHTNTHAVIHSSRNTVCEYHQCERERCVCMEDEVGEVEVGAFASVDSVVDVHDESRS